jgi:hypothetical protein
MSMEIWRTTYGKYKDQTGATQGGTLVLERLVVSDTGKRYDVDDGYNMYPALGTVWQAKDGRLFEGSPETVDYSGGYHLREIDAPARPERILATRAEECSGLHLSGRDQHANRYRCQHR